MPLDGHGHLVKQGWSGKGSGLRNGAIAKPITITQKKTLAGIGKDRDEAFPFWDHVFQAAAVSIQLKIHKDSDEESNGGDSENEGSETPALELRRTATGIISNRRPVAGTPALSGATTPSDSQASSSSSSGSATPQLSVMAVAKQQAARRMLYAMFYRGPVLAADQDEDDDEDEREGEKEEERHAEPSSSAASASSAREQSEERVSRKSKKRRAEDDGEKRENKRRKREAKGRAEKSERQDKEERKKSKSKGKGKDNAVDIEEGRGGCDTDGEDGQQARAARKAEKAARRRRKEEKRARKDAQRQETAVRKAVVGDSADERQTRPAQVHPEPIPVDEAMDTQEGAAAEEKSVKSSKKKRSSSNAQRPEKKAKKAKS